MTQQQLRDRFDYHSDGYLILKKDLLNGFKAGTKVEGRIDKLGYRIASFENKNRKLHRMIFLWHFGFLPKHVDHKDRDRTNNRIENLRAADSSTNTANSSVRVGFVPYRGVSWHTRHQKYISHIRCQGKSYHLGYFESAVLAAVAYDQKAKTLFGEFACINFPSL